MKTCLFTTLVTIAMISTAPASEPPSKAGIRTLHTRPLLLTGGDIVDSSNEKILHGYDLLVVGHHIKRIALSGTIGAAHARRIDVSGLTLSPGLIDLHSHLLLHPYDETSWNDQVLKESLELRTIRAVVAARDTITAGFTTLRDLGTEGAGYADVALRDAIDQGIITGPRIFAVTRALVATGCYGPSGFDPRWDVPKGAQVADGVDGVRKATREQIANGADWIKVYADYRRKPGITTATFSQEELNAIVHEANTAGLPVTAHATIDEAIRRAVIAGVDTIEHGYDASENILTLMRDRGVVLCPTLAASESMARYSGWSMGQPDHPRIIKAKNLMKRALRVGVVIANGSDVGVFSHGDNLRELELMVEYGMSNIQAFQSATSIAASVLEQSKLQGGSKGNGRKLGRLHEGFLADIIGVRGNPLTNVSVLQNPSLVIKDGDVIVHPSIDD